jgi:ribonuclease Z
MTNYTKYPLIWIKDKFSIKIFCSIPNISTGILIKADKSLLIVDPGDGILRDLNEELTTTAMLSISDILVTHGHHDHIGGVWSLLTYLRVMGKTSPLRIYFPKGCKEIVSIINAFNKVYAKSLTYNIQLIEIDGQKQFKHNNVIIKPFKVLHKETSLKGEPKKVPSLGYKFIYDKKSICYGGDTAYCQSLEDMAKNSDLAIIEAAALYDEHSDMHLSLKQAKEIAKTAKDYFLVHVPEKN